MEKERKKKTLPPGMAVKKWKPGQSGNPRGRPPNVVSKVLRDLTVQSYRDIVTTVLSGNMEALKEIMFDDNRSVLEVGLARGFFNAMKAGDTEVIERLVSRIVGKIPEELNVNAVSTNRNLNVNANGDVDPAVMKAALAKLNEEV